MQLSPSRRGLIRGASGLAAAAMVGCPKPEPLPEVGVADLLAGLDLTPKAVEALVRTLAAGGLDAGGLLVQKRCTIVVSRSLTGPSLVDDALEGMVLRIERGGSAAEVATSRVDDDTLAALPERLDLKPAPPPVEGAEPVPSPLKPSPSAPLGDDLPALDVVGAGLALLVDAVRAGTPRSLVARWEGVTDDCLHVHQDGRVQRSVQRYGRLTVEGEFVGAAGLHRVVRHFPGDVFGGADPATTLATVSEVVLGAVAARAEAWEPKATPTPVLLLPEPLAELALVAVRAGSAEHGPTQRVAFDAPRSRAPVMLARLDGGERVEANAFTAGLRVRSLRGLPERLDDGTFILTVDDAEFVDASGSRVVAAGTTVTIPKAALAAPARFVADAGEPSLTFEMTRPFGGFQVSEPGFPSVTVGPAGEPVRVAQLVSARLLDDCLLEDFRG